MSEGAFMYVYPVKKRKRTHSQHARKYFLERGAASRFTDDDRVGAAIQSSSGYAITQPIPDSKGLGQDRPAGQLTGAQSFRLFGLTMGRSGS